MSHSPSPLQTVQGASFLLLKLGLGFRRRSYSVLRELLPSLDPKRLRSFRSFFRLSASSGSNLGQWGRSSWRPAGVGSWVTGFRFGGAGARRRGGRRERLSLAGDLGISGNLP